MKETQKMKPAQESNPSTEKKGKKILRTILNTVINILIVVVLITSILIAVMAITSKASGVSTILGNTIQPIQSDSMKGGSPDGYAGGDFEHGDLMIAKATDSDPSAVYDLGDIVTFRTRDSQDNVMLIVHRIVDVVKNDNGTYTYQTQGDNRETSPVPDQESVSEYISAMDIVSVYYTNSYTGKILKGWGKIIDFLQTQQGFFFVVLLPMIIFFVYELIRVIMNYMKYKNSKAEEEKKEAVKAAVAAAKAENGMQDLPESLAEMTPEQIEQFKQFMAQQKQKEETSSAE